MTTSDLVNIAAHLPEMADRQPDTPALHLPIGRTAGNYRTITFRELDQETDRLARGLMAIGVQRGTRTALMVPPSLEFFAVTFALFKIGAVPVLIDPGMGLRNLGRCLAEAEPEAFIGVPKAHLARVRFGWAKKTLRITITTGKWRVLAKYRLDDLQRMAESAGKRFPIVPTTADDLATILFTSGSTGVAKGVVYTHGNFAAQVEAVRTTFGIEPGEIDLPTFPLFALFAPALGMTAVIPRMDFTRPGDVNAANIFEPAEQFQITTMFGSPALLKRLVRDGKTYLAGNRYERQLPDSLRRVISAGAPVPAHVLESLFGEDKETGEPSRIPLGIQVFTPYGATEALPVCVIGSDEILQETRQRTDNGAGTCVGRPVEGIELRIITITDAPIDPWRDALLLPAGEIGEIVVKGPWVTRAYYNLPDTTRLAKIVDPRGGIWHRMGDVGWQDEQSRVWYCGRKSHRVETPSRTLFSDPVEGIFNAAIHPVRRRIGICTALVGVRNGANVVPVLCVQIPVMTMDGGNFEEFKEQTLEILAAAGARHPMTESIKTVLVFDEFPVDIRHNAKIFREKLAIWAARKLRWR